MHLKIKRKLLHDISANAMQVVVNQLCGFCIFYILSIRLSKNDFGELNWSLAVLLTLFGILSFGIDQVFVKRIALGHAEKNIFSVYISHVLLSGFLLYTLLLGGTFIFSSFFQAHHLLLLLGIGKMMVFFSTPFKQLAIGMERFRPLLLMSICSNVLRSIALAFFFILGFSQLYIVVLIFIIGDLAELVLCFFITKKVIAVPVKIAWDKIQYINLLKESLPQFGVTIFTSVLARFDWIFLGLFTTNIILSDYSFAYKIFEMSTLPMLIIAPVLIPRFTKIFQPKANDIISEKMDALFFLFRLEMIIAAATVLVLNILWTPVIELVTHGKYGSVNQQAFFILSLSIPFLYLNNFLWTINFAKGRLKMILFVFAITFLVNVAADIILIPFYKGQGAAIGYFIAIVVQSVLYLYHTKLIGSRKIFLAILICPASALASIYISSFLLLNTILKLVIALFLFLFFLAATRQLRSNDRSNFKQIIGM